ncbi:metallophosphoesterase [Methanococcus sp. CF]
MKINGHEIYFKDNTVFLEKNKTLILADVHVGLEEFIRRTGVLFPLNEKKELLERIKKLIVEFKPEKLVFLGDFLHHFQKVPYKVYETVKELNSLLKNHDVIVIRGNHDIMLEYILKENTDFKILSYLLEDKILMVHGDKTFDVDSEFNLLIMGHEHPVLEINKQRFPSYLEIVQNDFEILVAPAFSNIASGVKINELESNFMSPYLKKVKKEDIFPIVIGEEVFKFPDLSKIEKFL